MKVFLDTSLLVKLYHEEPGTKELDAFFEEHSVKGIVLSELSKIEFNSAIWKKVRTGDLEEADAITLQNAFSGDYEKYEFVELTSRIIEQATELIAKYGAEGLRTLDAIQLSCAIEAKEEISWARTADEKLGGFFQREGIGA